MWFSDTTLIMSRKIIIWLKVLIKLKSNMGYQSYFLLKRLPHYQLIKYINRLSLINNRAIICNLVNATISK